MSLIPPRTATPPAPADLEPGHRRFRPSLLALLSAHARSHFPEKKHLDAPSTLPHSPLDTSTHRSPPLWTLPSVPLVTSITISSVAAPKKAAITHLHWAGLDSIRHQKNKHQASFFDFFRHNIHCPAEIPTDSHFRGVSSGVLVTRNRDPLLNKNLKNLHH